MNHKAVRFLVGSQFLFLVGLIICILIKPGVVSSNGALSVYGTISSTAIPYSISLFLATCLTFKAAQNLSQNSKTNKTLSRFLKILAVLQLGILVTPFSVNDWLFYAHMLIALSFFFAELTIGLWLLKRARFDFVNLLLVSLQITGSLIALLSIEQIKVLELIALGQLIAVVSFAVILNRSVIKIENYNPLNDM